MTPEGRGRFCAACQKTVTDFTKATDREIVTAYNQDAKLCGRFLSTQLDRELAIPKEKKGFWGAAAALALLTLGSAEALAQKPAKEQSQAPTKKRQTKPIQGRTITGIITDETGYPAIGAQVKVAETGAVAYTDIEGNFSIIANTGNRLLIEYLGYQDCEWAVTADSCCVIALDPDESETVTVRSYISVKRVTFVAGGPVSIKSEPVKKRTFLGRVFHAIGSVFR